MDAICAILSVSSVHHTDNRSGVALPPHRPLLPQVTSEVLHDYAITSARVHLEYFNALPFALLARVCCVPSLRNTGCPSGIEPQSPWHGPK